MTDSGRHWAPHGALMKTEAWGRKPCWPWDLLPSPALTARARLWERTAPGQARSAPQGRWQSGTRTEVWEGSHSGWGDERHGAGSVPGPGSRWLLQEALVLSSALMLMRSRDATEQVPWSSPWLPVGSPGCVISPLLPLRTLWRVHRGEAGKR